MTDAEIEHMDEAAWSAVCRAELEKIAADAGGPKFVTSFHVVCWARNHPQSAHHAMFNWDDAYSDEQRASDYDAAYLEAARAMAIVERAEIPRSRLH